MHAYKDLPSSWACKDEWKEQEVILGKKGWHDQSQGQGKTQVQVMFRVWNFRLEKSWDLDDKGLRCWSKLLETEWRFLGRQAARSAVPCRVSTAGRKYTVSRKVGASIRKSFARLYLRISKNQGQPRAYPRGTRQGRKKVSLRSGVQECHFAL